MHAYLDYFDLPLATNIHVVSLVTAVSSNIKHQEVSNYAKRCFLLAIPKPIIIVFLQNNNDIAVVLDNSLIRKWAGMPDYGEFYTENSIVLHFFWVMIRIR